VQPEELLLALIWGELQRHSSPEMAILNVSHHYVYFGTKQPPK
jgi:hypothetical protein